MTEILSGDALSPGAVLALYPPHRDTLPSLLSSRVAVCPDREAVRFEGRSWTYGDLERASLLVAQWFTAQGLAPGARVAHVATNSDTTLIVFLAVARLGAVFVPLNSALTDDDLTYQLGHCKAEMVLTSHDLVSRIETLWSPRDPAATTVSLDAFGHGTATSAEALALMRATLRGVALDLPPPTPDSPLVVIYTSGTTGRPKGVLHSHRNFVWASEVFVSRLWLQPTERLLTVFPLFHINALAYSFGGALACGGTFITVSRFSASTFWQTAVETEATQLNILAALGNILGRRPRSEFRAGHRIRKIYGGPISDEMFRLFREEFGVPCLIEGYGMSEIPATFSNPFDGPQKPGSIGVAAAHPRLSDTQVAVRVVDDDGRPVPVGEPGELLVKSPLAFLGYLDDEAQTREAFDDGWFRTGDLVKADGGGYHYFVARKKDIIRRRGENISGAEIDAVLLKHPEVVNAAAVAVPSELGDDEIMVVLVRQPDSTLDHEAVLDWCRVLLASIKVPRFIAFADRLPMTPSHRVAKHVLARDAAVRAQARDMSVTASAPEA